MAEKKKQVTSISKAQTLEEIAEFWDTHSLADFADRVSEIKFEVRASRHRVGDALFSSSLRDGDFPSKQSPRTSRKLLGRKHSQ